MTRSADQNADDASRLMRLARMLEQKARLLAGIVRWVALGAAAVAVWLWAVVVMLAAPEGWGGVLVGALLVVLLGPAAILGVFYWGLYDLMKLPERLALQVERGRTQATSRPADVPSASRGISGRFYGFLQRLWRLRSMLLESRALLIRYGAMVRLVTPFFVLLVVGAVVVSGLMIPVAAIATLVLLLF